MAIRITRSMNRNLTEVTIGEITIWFSCETPVAYHTRDSGYVVCENIWSNTTGRHLNSIDSGRKKDRIPQREFALNLMEIQSRINTNFQEAESASRKR